MKDFYLWCDFIERDFLEGEFPALLDQRRVFGATSNPVIFAQAIQTSQVYQKAIAKLKSVKTSAKDTYETLVVKDIKRCAELLLALWRQNKATGYISLEIDPFLADNVSGSVAEARSLFKRIGMPNVMIKIPATPSGLEVMEHLANLKEIPLNATLVFGANQAQDCALALTNAPMAVVSIFVSRVDTLANELIQEAGNRLSLERQAHLQYQVGIANAQECYSKIRATRSHIYPLFASTGVKAPHLPKDYYLQALKLEHSMITAPLEALQAFYDHPSPPPTLFKHTEIKDTMQALGLDLNKASPQLLQKGLDAFKGAFEGLLKTLA